MSFQKSNIIRYIKIFAISVVFLIKCNFLFAQKDLTDSAKIYEYWAKRGVIEVVYAYMNDYITTVTDSSLPKEKIKDCTKETNGLNEYEKHFISPLEKIEIKELSSKLNEVSSFLKNNNWSGAEKNVLQPLLIYLREENKLDNDFFSTLKPSGNEKSTVIPGYSNKMNNWNKTVDKILSAYNEDLKKLKPVNDTGNKPPGTSDTTNTPIGGKVPNPTVSENQNWIFAVIGFLSFLIGLLICYFMIKSRIYSLLDDDKETYKKTVSKSLFSFLSMVRLLKKRKDEYKNKVTELERKIEKLEKKSAPENDSISMKSGDYIDTEKTKVSDENLSKSIEWDLSKDGGNKSESYFSIPENDGRFIIDKGEQTNDGSKYYKIVYRTNSDEGDLLYISGPQDKRAINRLDSYLKPVCDIDNIINAEIASKIEVLKNGKVIKISDSWVIDTNHKVKIKLV
jgi:hypothetical protein